MTTIEQEVIINLPRVKCWEILRDLTQAHNYVPDVFDTQITTEQKEGVGASRKVYMDRDPDGMDETVIDWQDGHGFTIQIHKGDDIAIPIFKEFHFKYAIEDAGDNTRFHPSMHYQTRFGPLGSLLSTLVIKKAMGKTLAVICQSMKEYYETGEPTSEERIAEIMAGV